MNTVNKIWSKDYHGFESLYDLERDISECLDKDFNPQAKLLPSEFNGIVRVVIEYLPSKEEIEAHGKMMRGKYLPWSDSANYKVEFKVMGIPDYNCSLCRDTGVIEVCGGPNRKCDCKERK